MKVAGESAPLSIFFGGGGYFAPTKPRTPPVLPLKMLPSSTKEPRADGGGGGSDFDSFTLLSSPGFSWRSIF